MRFHSVSGGRKPRDRHFVHDSIHDAKSFYDVKNKKSNAKKLTFQCKTASCFGVTWSLARTFFLLSMTCDAVNVFWRKMIVLKWCVGQERRQNGLQFSSKMTCGTRKTSAWVHPGYTHARLKDVYGRKWVSVATSKMPSANWPIGYLVTYLS